MDLQRGDVGGWDHYWISAAGPSSAIIGAAYMGYMDITFPHGCLLCNDMNIDIWDRDLRKESFSQTMKNALPVIF